MTMEEDERMPEPTPDLMAIVDRIGIWLIHETHQKPPNPWRVETLEAARDVLERTATLERAAERVAAINTTGNALPAWASEPVEELRRVLYGDKPFLPRES